ncbi:hypothetical protein DXG01_012037 [Tephrocybe rancida]|nr:hypothetical protein DXG01_012037 [Tephrocybe rancida]
MAERKLVVYKPFGTFFEANGFDDVKSRIFAIHVYFPSPRPGANGINGLKIRYLPSQHSMPQEVTHGTLSGDEGIVNLGFHVYITDVIATMDHDERILFALTFKLSDGSTHGPFSGAPFPGVKDVSAPGHTVGFYGSLTNDHRISSLGVYARELPLEK